MRPIEFRLVCKDMPGRIFFEFLDFNDLIFGRKNIEVDGRIQEVIGKNQFTGLLDRNGKKIWEGDLVKCGEWIMVVKWIHGAFRWKCNDQWTNECASANGNMQIVEVIGNIYENSSLLDK